MKIQLIYQKEESEEYKILHEETLPRGRNGWQVKATLFPPPPEMEDGVYEFWFIPEQEDGLQEVALKGCAGKDNMLVVAQAMIGDMEFAATIMAAGEGLIGNSILDARITDLNLML